MCKEKAKEDVCKEKVTWIIISPGFTLPCRKLPLAKEETFSNRCLSFCVIARLRAFTLLYKYGWFIRFQTDGCDAFRWFCNCYRYELICYRHFISYQHFCQTNQTHVPTWPLSPHTELLSRPNFLPPPSSASKLFSRFPLGHLLPPRRPRTCRCGDLSSHPAFSQRWN